MSDIDIAVADSLKVLDLKRPIREATEALPCSEMTRWAICRLMHCNQQYPYSSTSSARASSKDGMVRPSAFAAIRFMTSSNLVG